MNVEELRQLSQELTLELEEEKAERDACVLEEDESRMNAEIADIEIEIAKVNQLIEIYANSSQPYRIMKLERLYMALMKRLSEDEFVALSEEKKFEIYNEFFPDEWVLNRYVDDEKEDMLLTAISGNQRIVPKVIQLYPNSGIPGDQQ